ncbi:MAG: class I SAM-dependent methyltransferase, partial [Ruminococcaceae bacterium]|nr:class I SAM-dependent methyltransferase [Oscillospiraceae bacterium]
MSEKYGSNFHAEFFVAGCDHDHNDRDVRVNQYKSIAKKIIDIFAPKTFLDVGCAYGYLVEALRDLGVEAYGMDASSHAISMVREDIKPYCFIADAMEKLPNSLPERFDCVSSIEVVEQLCEEDAQSFIHILCSCTDTVIFLSAADDFKEKKHYNVQQEDWAKRFALEGFLRDLVTDISFISAEALIYRKEKKTTLKLIEDYERAARLERAFCKKELQSVIDNKDDIEKSLEELQREMETVNREKNVISLELKNLRIHKHKLEADYNSIKNSTFWKLTLPAQRIVGGIRKLFKLNSSPSTSPAKDSSISAASYWKTYHPKAIPSPTVAPIDTYFLDEKVARLNLVVDGIDAVNLLGGVATSLILATLFVSRHKGMILRIITRHFPADPLDYLYIMEMNGIAPAQQVEYYSDWNRDEHG